MPRQPIQSFEEPPWLGLALCAVVVTGCSFQDSRLITSNSAGAGGSQGGATSGGRASGGSGGDAPVGGGPVTAAVVAAIDERPIGGASLNGMTTGGGTYASAQSAGRLFIVNSIDSLRERVSGDIPTVILIAEGTYTFAVEPVPLMVCTQTCDPNTPVPSQLGLESRCTNGEKLFEYQDTHEILRIGKNKTVIGLGNGAVLRNVTISLGGSSNVILRNLTIRDLNPTVNGGGDGLSAWPTDHVWLDHLTIANIARAYLNIVSSWDEENDQALTIESGYMTLTHNHFDGRVEALCGQRSTFVLGTSRNPALTLAYNWFHRSSQRNGYFFGPGTWAHLFNNLWSDIDGTGASAVCGAAALLQGNVFQSTKSALYNNDDGLPVWKFCADGLYGKVYAPTQGGSDEDNLLDESSMLDVNDQPLSGAGLALPARTTGHRFTIAAPTASGSRSEQYEVTLAAAASSVSTDVQASAGAGHLF
ncbi:MAG TPA: hypothetical protein VG937_29450 [Polyangiaceae bacterium]|nr:hypothetical protein [Polyangiaceae bacterium]